MTGPRAREKEGGKLSIKGDGKRRGQGAFFVPIGSRRRLWADTIVSAGRSAATGTLLSGAGGSPPVRFAPELETPARPPGEAGFSFPSSPRTGNVTSPAVKIRRR